jgi:hypothetical protein
MDGDGVPELAIGAYLDDEGGDARGAVYISFLNSDGTIKSNLKIGHQLNGGPPLINGDHFGRAVTKLDDMDGDGVAELAIGAIGDNTGGTDQGAVYISFLNLDGTVKFNVKIANTLNGGPTLTNLDFFGRAVTQLDDMDGDGVPELAIGAIGDDTGGSGRGAVYISFLNSNGTVKSNLKIASGLNGGPTLTDEDNFGGAVTKLDDMDGDGVPELVTGADGDNTGGPGRGAVYISFLNSNGTVKSNLKIASGLNGGPTTLAANDNFGGAVTQLDLNGDGIPELVTGATGDDTEGTDRGALYISFFNGSSSSTSSPTSSASSIILINYFYYLICLVSYWGM